MRRSTLIFILLFIVMAGAYYYLKNRAEPSDTADIAVTLEPATEIRYLFDAEDGTPNRIRLETNTGEAIELARDPDAENAWVVIQPFEAAADQGSSEAAASQVTTMSITGSVPNVESKDVGLDNPHYKIIVEFSTGVGRIAEVGVHSKMI